MEEEIFDNKKITDIFYDDDKMGYNGVRAARITRKFNQDGTLASIEIQDNSTRESLIEQYQKGKVVEIIKRHDEVYEHFDAKGNQIKVREYSRGDGFTKKTTRNPKGEIIKQEIDHYDDKKVTIKPKRNGLRRLLDTFKGKKDGTSFEYEGSGRGTVVDKLAEIDSKKEMDRQRKKRALVAEYRHEKVDLLGGWGHMVFRHKAPNPKVQKALEKYLKKEGR